MSIGQVTYRDRLLDEFGKEGYAGIKKSFDVLGNIAIIDAEGSNAKRIAKAVMQTHKRVETVLRKGGPVSGRYRVRAFRFVAGKRNYLARYNENGASFIFDVRRVFFSPRLAYERKRIAEISSDGEKVVVMFAGVGPFAIEIAKGNRSSEIVAIEANRYAYRYMVRNVLLNKTGNVVPVLGRVESVSRQYSEFADRIVMPLPGESRKYLDAAFEMAGKVCKVHYYVFSRSSGKDEIKDLREFAREKGFAFTLLGRRSARPYSALIAEMAIDFRIRRR